MIMFFIFWQEIIREYTSFLGSIRVTSLRQDDRDDLSHLPKLPWTLTVPLTCLGLAGKKKKKVPFTQIHTLQIAF